MSFTCFVQYYKARFGLWKPEVGATYQADSKWKPNPFKPDDRPTRVKVISVKEEFVQFRWPSGALDSNSFAGFASYFIKVEE